MLYLSEETAGDTSVASFGFSTAGGQQQEKLVPLYYSHSINPIDCSEDDSSPGNSRHF